MDSTDVPKNSTRDALDAEMEELFKQSKETSANLKAAFEAEEKRNAAQIGPRMAEQAYKTFTMFVFLMAITSDHVPVDLLLLNVVHGVITMFSQYLTIKHIHKPEVPSLVFVSIVEVVSSAVYAYRMYEMPSYNNLIYTLSFIQMCKIFISYVIMLMLGVCKLFRWI